MTKRLMIGLLTGVLLATMLPGVAVAKEKVDKPFCKNGGWTQWVGDDGTVFADQGECVAYVAEGGILVPPGPTFQSVCEGYGGQYAPSQAGWYNGEPYTYAPACLWWGISYDTWATYVGPLTAPPYCPQWGGGEHDPSPDDGSGVYPDVTPDWLGCL